MILLALWSLGGGRFFSLKSFKGLELGFVCLELVFFLFFFVLFFFSLLSSKGLDTILVFLIVYSVQYHLKRHNVKSLRSYSSGFLGMQSNTALGSSKVLILFFWDKARYFTNSLCPFQHKVKQFQINPLHLAHTTNCPTTKVGGSVSFSCHLYTDQKHTWKCLMILLQNSKNSGRFLHNDKKKWHGESKVCFLNCHQITCVTLPLGQVTEIERTGCWDYCSSDCQQQFNCVHLNYNLTHAVQMNQKIMWMQGRLINYIWFKVIFKKSSFKTAVHTVLEVNKPSRGNNVCVLRQIRII